MMKSIYLFILAWFFAINGRAQEFVFTPIVGDSIDFEISGTADMKEKGDSLQVGVLTPGSSWKNYPMKDGKFSFTLRQPKNTFVRLLDSKGNHVVVMVEDTTVKVDLSSISVRGSEQQEEFVALQKTTHGDERNTKMVIEYLRRNQDSHFAAYFIDLYSTLFSYEELKEFMRPDAVYAHDPILESTCSYFTSLQTRQQLIGNSFPDFESEAPDGTMHQLSEYAGKGQYVLIDFWASWCGPCRGAIPYLKEAYERFKDKGLQVIGLSSDEDVQKWKSAMDKEQMPWINLRTPARPGAVGKNKVFAQYGCMFIPFTVLISSEGKVLLAENTTDYIHLLEKYLEK